MKQRKTECSIVLGSYKRNKRLASGVHRRKTFGNMLMLTIAVLGVICLIFAAFGFKFIGLLGSNHEQRTAIEAASIASADALGRIVIEDADLGFVGLADNPPIGLGTVAADNYYLPVTGINSLLGRTRLDMIIADQLQDDTMKKLALADYAKVMQVKDKLIEALKAACQPGATAKDADGKDIDLYAAAIKAYKSNAIRIVSADSALDQASVKLTLGTVVGVASNCRAPFPDKFRNATDDFFQDGYYKSSVNVPYQQKDFVFAAANDHSTLIDAKRFEAKVAGLPYIIPSVVCCEADHIIGANSGERHTLHALACSVAAASNQELANSGYLCFNFSSGRINKYDSPKDLIWSKEIGHSPADLLQTATGGDYPPNTLMDTTIDGSTSHPLMENLMKRGLYDWLKRGGSRVDVQAFLDMLGNNFPTGLASTIPQIVRYNINKTGNIDATVVETGSRYFLPVSNNQFFARTEMAVKDDKGKFYDLFIRDYVFKQGRTSSSGGLHAGEPLLVNDFMGPAANPDEPKGTYNKGLDQDPNLAASFPTNPGGKRETYLKPGVAVEFKLRLR